MSKKLSESQVSANHFSVKSKLISKSMEEKLKIAATNANKKIAANNIVYQQSNFHSSEHIISSTDISFEDRYKKLLEGINEEELVPLPNLHENDVVESIDEINCAEDGFIARYCLGNIVSVDELPQPAKSKVLKK